MHSSSSVEGLISYSKSNSRRDEAVNQCTDSVPQCFCQSVSDMLLRAFALLLQACRAHL